MLRGVRILDLTRLLPGPYASFLLAGLGAEVIKVEDPRGGDPARGPGGGRSPVFDAINRHKKSVAIDLKHPRGREIFLRLATTCDAVMESFRPGVADRLGVGYEAAREVNPRIVYASLTGWGQSGPLRNLGGHDVNYLSIAGVLGVTGVRDGQPVIPGVQVADLGGGMLCALGILAGLNQARATGQGTYLDVAMYDLLVSWLTVTATQYFSTGKAPGRGSHRLSGEVVCYNVYPTADGQWVSIGALEPKFWANFCEAVGRPDLLEAAFTPAVPGSEGYEQVRALFLTRTRAEWAQLGETVDCCLTPVLSLPEAMGSQQATERGIISCGSGGAPLYPAHPLRNGITGERGVAEAEAPALGGHTREILSELGVSEEEQEELRKVGAVAY